MSINREDAKDQSHRTLDLSNSTVVVAVTAGRLQTMSAANQSRCSMTEAKQMMAQANNLRQRRYTDILKELSSVSAEKVTKYCNVARGSGMSKRDGSRVPETECAHSIVSLLDVQAFRMQGVKLAVHLIQLGKVSQVGVMLRGWLTSARKAEVPVVPNISH